MNTRTRLTPKDRKATILSAACDAAVKFGFGRFTRENVATAAAVSPALVSHYYSTMVALRRAVMGAAIKEKRLRIIAEGIVLRDKRALGVDSKLREAAMKELA
ncbi:MAG: hypothetical protein YHS30scaffold667_52 [Phage 65_10]|nr:MAG: hypothetical protein YHS30scaffold667_52 [Phage 65_10]